MKVLEYGHDKDGFEYIIVKIGSQNLSILELMD